MRFHLGQRARARWDLPPGLWLAFAGLALASVTATAQPDPYEPPAPGPEDEIIASFDARKAGSREVSFEWTVVKRQRGEELGCRIDADGDDIFEYSMADCEDERSHRHRYDAPGTYQAVLLIHSDDGGKDRATTRVVIGE